MVLAADQSPKFMACCIQRLKFESGESSRAACSCYGIGGSYSYFFTCVARCQIRRRTCRTPSRFGIDSLPVNSTLTPLIRHLYCHLPTKLLLNVRRTSSINKAKALLLCLHSRQQKQQKQAEALPSRNLCWGVAIAAIATVLTLPRRRATADHRIITCRLMK